MESMGVGSKAMTGHVKKRVQRRHYDRLSEDYARKIDEKGYKYYFEFTRGVILGVLKGCLEEPDRCDGLDVGCGNGDLTAAMRQVCRTMTGVDLSKGMISSARERNPQPGVRFIVTPSDCLPFRDSEFDFCVTTHLLHHLADDGLMEDTFAEVSRVTKDGGLIVVVDVNRVNPFSVLIQHLMVKRGVDTGNEKLVWPSTILRMFRRNGIAKVRYNGYCMVPHFFPGLKRLNPVLERSFLNKFLGKDYIIVGKVAKGRRRRPAAGNSLMPSPPGT